MVTRANFFVKNENIPKTRVHLIEKRRRKAALQAGSILLKCFGSDISYIPHEIFGELDSSTYLCNLIKPELYDAFFGNTMSVKYFTKLIDKSLIILEEAYENCFDDRFGENDSKEFLLYFIFFVVFLFLE